MISLNEWEKTFDENIKIVKGKLQLYKKELADIEMLNPQKRRKENKRIKELQNLISKNTKIIDDYNNPNYNHERFIFDDKLISPVLTSSDVNETEFGDQRISYLKCKQELLEEYFEILADIKEEAKVQNKKDNIKLKEKCEELYFIYCNWIKKAPEIRKGFCTNINHSIEIEKDYQEYINEYQKNKKLYFNADIKCDELRGIIFDLKNQMMNSSNSNKFEKLELKKILLSRQIELYEYNMDANSFDAISQIALIKLQTIKGYIKPRYQAYLCNKIELEKEIKNTQLLSQVDKCKFDKNDIELRKIAYSEAAINNGKSRNYDPKENDEKRRNYLRLNESLKVDMYLKNRELSDLRRKKLKQEIIHAYNECAISLSEKNSKLGFLSTFVYVDENVEKEVSLYSSSEKVEETVEEVKSNRLS